MITRHLLHAADEMMHKYPIISITGPRQSGKTTFAKLLRPDYQYVSLEDPDHRQFAQDDPRGFLQVWHGGTIIDEIQYAPELFSYLQTHTDKQGIMGEFILTGSQNFLLLERISQSLAGRVSLFTLLPLSYAEMEGSDYPPGHWQRYLYRGSYPRLWVADIAPDRFYADYLQTYLERDVRQLIQVHKLSLFQRFIQLLAGYTGQLFHQSRLATEVGVDSKTISAWLSVLEASFLIYRLPPYYQNFHKRIIKSPKVYFFDTGLAAYLLGLRSQEDLDVHFSRGALFENLVITEMFKKHYNQGNRLLGYYWRDSQHNEIDFIFEEGSQRHAYEIKISQTLNIKFFAGLNHFRKVAPDTQFHLVYGGDIPQVRQDISVHTFGELFRGAK